MTSFNSNLPRIVRSWAGEGTGETIREDQFGTIYREVSRAEAQMIRESTAGRVYLIDRYGTVR